MAFNKKITLDTVLSGFKTTLTQLDTLIADRQEAVTLSGQRETAARLDRQAAESDIVAARNARQNIEKLIEG